MAFTIEQLAKRQLSLGGSEIAAVCGVSPYKTALDVWRNKVLGERPEVPARLQECADWGERIEPVIRGWYADTKKKRVSEHSKALCNKNHTWATVTPDGLVYSWPYSEGVFPEWGLEIKNRSHTDKPRWQDDHVPCDVAAQAIWGMFVTGLPRWDVVALVDGNQPYVRTLNRLPALESCFVSVGEIFWKAVEAKTEPEMEWVEQELETIYTVLVNDADEAAFRRAAYWRKKDSKGSKV